MKILCSQCGAMTELDGPSGKCQACSAPVVASEAKTNPDIAAPADPRIGATVAGCRLIERIGAGGMGIVYKAEQLSLGRTVAVKLLPEQQRDDPQLLERFRREIVILAKLNHPSIIHILDGGVCEHGIYFIMEYVDGVTLRRVLSAETLRPEEALQIVRQLCDALEYAHGAGVVHRDIKPENILIDRDGRVRLLDFGLSRIITNEDPGILTRPTQVLGTFEYMAPEQREASRNVDHRADLYSLGVIIYEMLTRELPIGRFDPPSRRNVQIDVRLDDVVLRSLEKSPDRRYQRAIEVKTDVDRIQTIPQPPVAAVTPLLQNEPAPPPVAAADPPRVAPAAAPSAAPVPPPNPVLPATAASPARENLLAANLSLAFAVMTAFSGLLMILLQIRARTARAMDNAFVFGGSLLLLSASLTAVTAGYAMYTIYRNRDRYAGMERAAAAMVTAIAIPIFAFPLMILIHNID